MSHQDTILITGLELYAFHGASDEEQTVGHRYLVDVRLTVNLESAVQSDNLSDTVNYAEAAFALQQVATTHQYRLLEALAGEMIAVLFDQFPAVLAVWIRLQKRLPPFPAIVETVGVELTRHRT